VVQRWARKGQRHLGRNGSGEGYREYEEREQFNAPLAKGTRYLIFDSLEL
jgi:hypothetical protein